MFLKQKKRKEREDKNVLRFTYMIIARTNSNNWPRLRQSADWNPGSVEFPAVGHRQPVPRVSNVKNLPFVLSNPISLTSILGLLERALAACILAKNIRHVQSTIRDSRSWGKFRRVSSMLG